MQIQYVLVLLTLGAVTEEAVVFDPHPTYSRMKGLQDVIDLVEKETVTALQKMLADITNRKDITANTLSMELQDRANVFVAKLKQESEEAKKKGNGKNGKLIEKCVEKEQIRYIFEFGNNYKDSLTFINNATNNAKELVKRAKNYFITYSFVGKSHSDFLFQKWNKCPKTDQACADANAKIYSKRIDTTKKAAKESIENGNKAVSQHKLNMVIYVSQYKKRLVEMENKHKINADRCTTHPETVKA